ncbi:MAG: triose-phosphate isomerase [Phytoplasma sp.]|uniref:triose-phosphate isomerase n=1 Tax=Phytoplasma sp. TaxID=2155 RepID=UPI002B40E89F|nr:triose-phosphate isomerase [Phytoplasma sp.]WRH06657.1 MAG: triose-phosphate isomerase [Phytoplasma sp.]
MKKIVIAGNWKMNKCKDSALNFIYQINNKMPDRKKVETIIFPQTTLLYTLTQIEGKNLRIGAQNIFHKNEGSYTGEVSPKNIYSLGIKYSLVGHCERRTLFGETETEVKLKLLALLNANIYPILCIGEDNVVKQANNRKIFLDNQLETLLKDIPHDSISKIILAYEPFWAIGTGKSLQPEEANGIIKNIRQKIASLFTQEIANQIRIIYGGSVNVDNIEIVLRQKEIDGVLIGNSSLQVENFLFFAKIGLQIYNSKYPEKLE